MNKILLLIDSSSHSGLKLSYLVFLRDILKRAIYKGHNKVIKNT